MKKIGFNTNPDIKETAEPKVYAPVVEEPKLSVVTVRFESGKEFPYVNDKFHLSVGDRVYVDGSLKGEIGEVTAVTTKFKVSLKYYKYVLQKIDFDIHGSFKPVADFFVSRADDAVPTEQLMTWLPPVVNTEEEPEERFVCGEGYSIDLNDIENNKDFDYEVAEKGLVLLNEGYVKFISVTNGEGIAVIRRHHLHTVEFKLKDKEMTDIFCGCLDPNMCKHILAVAIALRKIVETLEIKENESFTAIESGLFFSATKYADSTFVV